MIKDIVEAMNITKFGEMNKKQIEELMPEENIKDIRVIFNNAKSAKAGKAYLDLVGKKSRVSVYIDASTGKLGDAFRETTVRGF